MKSLFQSIGYALSLPERTARSLAGAVGGLSKLMTDTLLPAPLRKTKFYDHFLGSTQRFLIESLGDVQPSSPTGEKLPDDFLPRKLVGNVVDGAGIFAFHFSPLWFFAIVGDVAGGTKDYLRRVVEELKKDGAIEEGEDKIDTAEELLEALSKASAKTALPFDSPPLSSADLKKLRDEIVHGYGDLYSKGKKAIPTIDTLWSVVEDVRKRDKVDFLKLMGSMTLASAKAVGTASGSMFYEKIIGSYSDSLTAVRKEGFGPFFLRESTPYIEAMAGAFSKSKKSWTEKLLSGDWFGKK
jgi:hypothetical protein